jgi:hypothetical protein
LNTSLVIAIVVATNLSPFWTTGNRLDHTYTF